MNGRLQPSFLSQPRRSAASRRLDVLTRNVLGAIGRQRRAVRTRNMRAAWTKLEGVAARTQRYNLGTLRIEDDALLGCGPITCRKYGAAMCVQQRWSWQRYWRLRS